MVCKAKNITGLGAPQATAATQTFGPHNLSESIHKEWYTRGYLPHYDAGKTSQMITYRLADSLPKERLEQFERELHTSNRVNQDDELRKKIEQWLDAGHGSCILSNKLFADILVENWQIFHGKRYDLISWVIMSNHVHVLINVYEGFPLNKIVLSWKNYTARKINSHRENPTGMQQTQRSKRLWQRGYWDRYARSENHFIKMLEYIKQNNENGGVRYGVKQGNCLE
jgi:REP-associated tyrosine transposase